MVQSPRTCIVDERFRSLSLLLRSIVADVAGVSLPSSPCRGVLFVWDNMSCQWCVSKGGVTCGFGTNPNLIRSDQSDPILPHPVTVLRFAHAPSIRFTRLNVQLRTLAENRIEWGWVGVHAGRRLGRAAAGEGHHRRWVLSSISHFFPVPMIDICFCKVGEKEK